MKKHIIKFLSLFMSTSILLSGCESVKTEEKLPDTSIEVEESNVDIPENIKSIDICSKKAIDDLCEYKIEYNYKDNYLSKEYINSLNNDINCTYKFDGNIDRLVEIIEKNTKDYCENGDYKTFFETEDNKEMLKSVLKHIYEDYDNNHDEDFHRISNLVIVFDDIKEDSDYYAIYDDEEDRIRINKELLKEEMKDTGHEVYEIYPYILNHELSHVRQNLCDCRKKDDKNTIAYDKYASFIIESSVVTDNLNNLDLDCYINGYTDERNNEAEILLLALFNNDSLDAYYDSIYDVDYDKFYSFFDLESDELKEFYDILYSIDAIMVRNSLGEEIMDEKLKLRDWMFKVGLNYNADIYKLYLKRLVKHISLNDISPLEALTLNLVAKNVTMDNSYIIDYDENDELNHVYDEESSKRIVELNTIFSEYIKKYYNISDDNFEELELEALCISQNIKSIIKEKEVSDAYTEEANELIKNILY